LLYFLFSVVAVAAEDDLDNDGIADSKEIELALKYVPSLHFAAGEKFFPTDINYNMSNPELFKKNMDDPNELIERFSVAMLPQYTTEDYFLNNTIGGYEEIAEHYKQNREIFGESLCTGDEAVRIHCCPVLVFLRL